MATNKMPPAREYFMRKSLGVTARHISQAKVLLVGAGGIGCELLKNLVLTGFGEIHIIDLDTIDLSNLNRQFLFRHEHIKKPKALVAKEVAQRFNPRVKLEARHANIKDSRFDVGWFANFDIVFNALDNLEARRHVNRMCLAADVPLIESGTTGFNGQVQVIKKGVTACYDCMPKTTPKSFPVCTIRSTPSQSIHCIVWAKSYLLSELFGETEDVVPELDQSEDSENAQEIAKLKEEAEALKKIRESMGSETFAKQIFDKVFKIDIERLARMEDMWKERSAPKPLDFEDLSTEAASIEPSVSQNDQNTWTTSQNFVVFRDSLSRLAKRLAEDKAVALANGLPVPTINFDKDDEDTLDFVTATANLRAQIFGIESKSKFDTKQMAGNIIPAIATTNAMIAGLCVMQAFKIYKHEFNKTKMMFLDRGNMSATASDKPDPGCVVCSAAMCRLAVDFSATTLNDLVQKILKEKLGYGDEIELYSEQGLIYDPDLEDNLEKKLSDLGIDESTRLVVKDVDDEGEEGPRVDLQLFVESAKAEDDDDGDDAGPLQLVYNGETFKIPRKPKKEKSEEILPNGNGTTEGTNGIVPAPSAKRKRDADEAELDAEATPMKKLQISKAAKEEIMIVEDDDGAIVLDDD